MMHLCRERKRGFTLIEVLIGLAITAILMSAVAVAFNASVVNYQENEQIFKTVSVARQALTRMTSRIRNAQAVDPNATAGQCSLITSNGEDITYSYDSSQEKLFLITNDVTDDADYVLCENVEQMNFTKDTAMDGGVTYVESVQIVMTVSDGQAEKRLAAAAVVRKNINR